MSAPHQVVVAESKNNLFHECLETAEIISILSLFSLVEILRLSEIFVTM